MIAGLVALIVAFVAVVVVLAFALAAVGLLIGGVVALVALAFKLAPFLLVGWIALKLGGGGGCRRSLPRSPRGRMASADDAWLDSPA
jgi:hypothetical protein